MKDWKELKKELLADPNVAKAYRRLEPEYRLAMEIIKLRRQRQWTQADLAQKAGMSQVMVARLESGESNPQLETIEKIAKALGRELRISLA